MFDEFLRASGSNPFKRGRWKRGKKGRGSRGRGRGSSAREEEMLQEAFMMAMGGMDGMDDMGAKAPVCPQGHNLKRRKSEAAEYECDVCNKDIVRGKRFYDCRKCDWCICHRCHKEASEKLEEMDEEGLLNQEEILEAFCEMHTTVTRQGKRLQHKCDICDALLTSWEKVLPHMEENHVDVIEAFLEEAMQGAGAAFPFPGMDMSPDELLMGMLGAGMTPPGQADAQGYPGSSNGPSRRSRKKKH